MLNLSFRYDQTAVRLQVEGLPDFSAGHGDGILGIISGWRLQLVASPELEGKREVERRAQRSIASCAATATTMK